ncbi:hypothetical protein [Acidisoma sp. 7E03]
MYQPQTQEQALLLRKITAEFRKHRWVVSRSTDYRYDLIVSSSEIKFSIKVISASPLVYQSVSNLLQQMETDNNALKITNHAPLLFLLGFAVDDTFLTKAKERGVLVATMTNLPEVVEVERFQAELPHTTTYLEASLLESQWKACLSISDRFKTADDLDSALRWARAAAKITRTRTAVPHRRLIGLLLEAQRLDEAKSVTVAALDLWPNDLGLLKTMALIVRREGIPVMPSPWKERLDIALEEQQRMQAVTDRMADKPGTIVKAPDYLKKPKKVKRGLLEILSKIMSG